MSSKINDKNKLTFKIITLGNSGVGKTSIINKYTQNDFENNSLSTIGIEFSKKELILKNQQKIELKLIDTCGQEKFNALSTSYFKHVDGVFFVFALNNKESFNNIKHWIDLFNQNNNSKKKIPKYLVGNKCDILMDKQVEKDLIDYEINKEDKDMKYFETSAKNNINIEKIFEEMGEKMYSEYIKSRRNDNIQIKHEVPKIKKKNNCCQVKSDA